LREFKSTSASQITTFRDCKRLWFYQSIMGIPTPQRPSAALGEAVHTHLEKYLNDGTVPDESQAGKIAQAGLSLLPKPGVVYTEVSMSGRGKDRKELSPEDESVPIPGGMPRLFVAGLPVNGFIDVLDISANKPVVLDHKCLPASAVVHTSEGPRRVGDLTSDWVCAAWTGTEVVATKALAPVDGGVQQVYSVGLHNGMAGRFGYSHPILVRERGWVAADALRVGDEVAVPLNLPDTPELPVPDALLKVTAMLLCDGALKSDSLTYTKTGEARLEYIRLLGELGVPCSERGLGRKGRAPYVQVSASAGSPLRRMLEDLGVDFVSSPLRRVPSRLMSMSKRQVGIFLGGIWAGDGAAYLINAGGKQKPVITFANRSKAFCEDVRDLLIRAGLAATFTETSISYKGERRPYYAATVVGKRSKVAFLERAISGGIAVGDRCSGRKTRAGNVPPTLDEVLAVARGLPEHSVGPRPVHIGEGDLWWVPVSSVIQEEAEPCFDIEVPRHHTFVAEGIITHNTTSSLDWAKTKEDLVEDVQMVLYGSYALDVVASMGVDADVVEAGHIVYLTKGRPYAQRTTVELTREHLASERKKIAETVEEMKETAKARTPDAVPGEASVCNKYGGCHFKDKCSALGMLNAVEVPTFVLRSTLAKSTLPPVVTPKENSMSIDPLAALASLRAKKAAAATNEPTAENAAEALSPTPPAPAPVVAPAATPAPVSNKSAATLAKYGITAPTAAPTPVAESIVPNDVPEQTRPSFAKPVSHTPAQPVAVPETVEVVADAPKATRKPKNYAEKLAALNWTPQQVERMTAESMRAAIEGNLDGKGYSVKPDGSIHIPGEGTLDTTEFAGHVGVPFEDEADEKKYDAVFGQGAAAEYKATIAPSESVHPSQQVAKGVPPAAAPAPVRATETEEHAAWEVQPTLVLYIDCAPEKGRDRGYVLLEDYIQPMLPLVVDAYNRGCKRDDEKVDFYSLIPYARGPGFVASLIMKSPPIGVIVCNTRFPATNAILEVLIPLADVVVRGIR